MKMQIQIPLPDKETQQEVAELKKSGLFDEFKLPTLLLYKRGWEQPTFEDVQLMKQKLGLSSKFMGLIVGVDGVTVRRWMSPGGKNARKIPFSAWRLFVLELKKKIK